MCYNFDSMGISYKTVKGTKYIYHYFYDPEARRKKEVYCGPESDPESKIRAYEYEEEWLSNQIQTMQKELVKMERRTMEEPEIQGNPDKMLNIDEIRNKILTGDALEIMKKIPSNSIDMTFADPPFNLSKSYNVYRDDKESMDYEKWCQKWLFQMVRITKPTGSIFVHNIPKWLTYHASYLNKIALFRHWIAWDAMGAPMGKTLLPSHYGILYYVKSKDFKFHDLRWPHQRCRSCGELLADYGGKKEMIHPFGTLLSDVWTDIHRIRHTKRRDAHPNQLPIPLLERLILMATDEGDVVLDPFIGTGTTSIAAKRLGRNYIGIDLDPAYIKIATEKTDAQTKSKINGAYVSMYLDKIQTIRDEDYESVSKVLQTKDLLITKEKFKQLTLPIVELDANTED